MALIDAAMAAFGSMSAGSLISAGTSLVGGLMGSDASSNAADVQSQTSDRTAAMQKAMFDQSQQNLAPYMQGGNVALSSMLGKMGDGSLGGSFTPTDFMNNKDPGYEFQRQQGEQALQNSQAAHDGVLSGSALKGLINYNQGAASTGYQSAYDRWLKSQQNTFGQLHDTATIGGNAAAGAGNMGSSYAGTIGGTMLGGANARASGMIGSANAMTGGLNGVGGNMYLSSLMNNGRGGYDSGFNGQNNPTNQAALDNVINTF